MKLAEIIFDAIREPFVSRPLTAVSIADNSNESIGPGYLCKLRRRALRIESGRWLNFPNTINNNDAGLFMMGDSENI